MFLRVMIVHFALCPSALLSQEKESQATTQASGPSEKELALEESIYTLQQERDALSLQYQAQVRTSVRATESWNYSGVLSCSPGDMVTWISVQLILMHSGLMV